MRGVLTVRTPRFVLYKLWNFICDEDYVAVNVLA